MKLRKIAFNDGVMEKVVCEIAHACANSSGYVKTLETVQHEWAVAVVEMWRGTTPNRYKIIVDEPKKVFLAVAEVFGEMKAMQSWTGLHNPFHNSEWPNYVWAGKARGEREEVFAELQSEFNDDEFDLELARELPAGYDALHRAITAG